MRARRWCALLDGLWRKRPGWSSVRKTPSDRRAKVLALPPAEGVAGVGLFLGTGEVVGSVSAADLEASSRGFSEWCWTMAVQSKK